MRYLRFLLVAGAALAGAAFASPSASAITVVLPEPTLSAPISATGTSTSKLSFETANGTKLLCEKATGAGEFTSGNDGRGEAHVTGCQSLGFSCNSIGAKSGEIILNDEIHYWTGLLAKKPIAVAIALITTPLLIECPAIGTKMEKRGCTAGQVPPESLNKKIKSVSGTLKQTKGKQEITEIIAPKTETVKKCISEISKNGGPFEEIGQEGSGITENFKQNGKALEVELMF
jgi:hypothetical protein